jgi:hypothetical protein
VPKRKEVLVIPTSKSNPLPYITIGSMEVPIIDKEGPIVIKDPVPSTHQDEFASGARVAGKEKHAERDPKYIQPKWCPRGLSKMERCKLQRARHNKQKKERLEKIREDIFNAIHPTFPQMSKREDATCFTKVSQVTIEGSSRPTSVLATQTSHAGLGRPG